MKAAVDDTVEHGESGGDPAVNVVLKEKLEWETRTRRRCCVHESRF
jgi:hypothetical protein